MSANPEASGMEGLVTFEGADAVGLLVEEDKLNTERPSGAAAVDVVEKVVVDVAAKGGCEESLVEPPEKSKRSALGGSAAFVLVVFVLGVNEKKSPNAPGELAEVCLFAGAFEAGGSKKEPPEPNPGDVELAASLPLDAAAKFDAGFDGAGVELKFRPLNASVSPLDEDCNCENGSGP